MLGEVLVVVIGVIIAKFVVNVVKALIDLVVVEVKKL